MTSLFVVTECCVGTSHVATFSVGSLLLLLVPAPFLIVSTPVMFTPVVSELFWSLFESSMTLPDLSVNTIPFYILHAVDVL